jgi:8-oxo-dGTP diphosphatase
MKRVNVVAAIIEKDGKFFCGKRNYSKYDYISYKWEFPGGKKEENESHQEALVREIREELDVEIKVIEHFLTILHEYPDFEIEMICYLCKQISGEIYLREHTDFMWLEINELNKLDWAEADIPIVNKLING